MLSRTHAEEQTVSRDKQAQQVPAAGRHAAGVGCGSASGGGSSTPWPFFPRALQQNWLVSLPKLCLLHSALLLSPPPLLATTPIPPPHPTPPTA